MFWYMQVDIPYMDDMGITLAPRTCHWQPLPCHLSSNPLPGACVPIGQRTREIHVSNRNDEHVQIASHGSSLKLAPYVSKQTTSNTLPLDCELMHDLLYPCKKRHTIETNPKGKNTS